MGYLLIFWVKLAGALWIIGGKLGSSLIFYFVAIDPRSTIQEKCEPKPIFVWGTVPQRVNILLIATFLYKNDSIELRYSDYEDSFQFLSHFRRFQA
jgi:hypothetical protein